MEKCGLCIRLFLAAKNMKKLPKRVAFELVGPPGLEPIHKLSESYPLEGLYSLAFPQFCRHSS
jgi:hypothetical protein